VLNLDTKSGLYLLERYLTPQDYIEMDVKQESLTLEALSNRQHGRETLEKLQLLAHQSIGCLRYNEEVMADRLMLNSWLSILAPIREAMDKVMDEIISLEQKHPGFAILYSLKGISKKMAALFIAEIRDPYLFDHYKKVEKMAGINLRLSQSGNSAGPRHISHMGNNRLRWVIYKMTEETAKYIPEVRIKFLKRQLKKRCYKKNLMAAAPQLLKLIIVLIKEGRSYEFRKESVEEMKRLEEKYEPFKKQQDKKRKAAA
jgi:transposase